MPSGSIDVNVLNFTTGRWHQGRKVCLPMASGPTARAEIQTSTRRPYLYGKTGGTSPARSGLVAQGLVPCG